MDQSSERKIRTTVNLNQGVKPITPQNIKTENKENEHINNQ